VFTARYGLYLYIEFVLFLSWSVNGLRVLVNMHSEELATGQINKLFLDFPRSYSILSVCAQIPRCSAHISAQSLHTELSATITYRYYFCSWAIVVTGLRVGRSGVRFSTEGRSFTLFQTSRPTSSGFLASYSFWALGFSLWIKLSRNETIFLHTVPRLRISGAVLLLPNAPKWYEQG